MKSIIYCVDIGSENKGNKFAWANSEEKHNTSLETLKESIIEKIKDQSLKIAIGFECPLFFGITEDSKSANKARPGIDGNKAWTAGAGAYALVTGLAQITWLFTQLNKELETTAKVLSSREEWEQGGPGIYVWEAFISGTGKLADQHDNPHIADCRAGIRAFEKSQIVDYDQNQPNFFSIIGAILLRTNCTSDKSVLSTPCLVIKP